MKKLTLYAMILLVSMSSITTLSATEKDSIVATVTTKEVPADVSKLLTRLDEINAIDKTTLNRLQKKELRKEVRVIKSELKEKRHGVYISVGAFIIIILLLVILL
jgi:hypothetical protein